MRIEGTIATLAPELKVIAPVRSWQMGRDEEIAYARKHGIPVKGGTESAPYSIDDNLWGRSSEGKWIEDLVARARRRRLPARHAAGARARRAAGRRGRVRARRAGGAGRRAARAGRPDRARGRDRLPARRRDRRPHRGPHRRPEGARHLRGAGGGDPADRPPRARAAGRHDPPEPVQAASSTSSGPTSSTPACGGSRCATDIEAYMRARQRARDRARSGSSSSRAGAGRHARESPNAVYDAQLATFAESGGLFSQQASPGFIEIWSLQSRMAQRVREAQRDTRGAGRGRHVLHAARHRRVERAQGVPAPQVRTDLRAAVPARRRRVAVAIAVTLAVVRRSAAAA